MFPPFLLSISKVSHVTLLNHIILHGWSLGNGFLEETGVFLGKLAQSCSLYMVECEIVGISIFKLVLGVLWDLCSLGCFIMITPMLDKYYLEF